MDTDERQRLRDEIDGMTRVAAEWKGQWERLSITYLNAKRAQWRAEEDRDRLRQVLHDLLVGAQQQSQSHADVIARVSEALHVRKEG